MADKYRSTASMTIWATEIFQPQLQCETRQTSTTPPPIQWHQQPAILSHGPFTSRSTQHPAASLNGGRSYVSLSVLGRWRYSRVLKYASQSLNLSRLYYYTYHSMLRQWPPVRPDKSSTQCLSIHPEHRRGGSSRPRCKPHPLPSRRGALPFSIPTLFSRRFLAINPCLLIAILSLNIRPTAGRGIHLRAPH